MAKESNDGGIDWRKYSTLTAAEKLVNQADHLRQIEERQKLVRAAEAELNALEPTKEVKP